MNFRTTAKRLVESVGKCELCGSKRNLEVHHIVPKVATIPCIDLDTEDNLIVLCATCHSKLTPKKILTKYGIAVLKERNEKTNKMKQFYEILENYDLRTMCDVIDVVEYLFADYLDTKQRQERKERIGIC